MSDMTSCLLLKLKLFSCTELAEAPPTVVVPVACRRLPTHLVLLYFCLVSTYLQNSDIGSEQRSGQKPPTVRILLRGVPLRSDLPPFRTTWPTVANTNSSVLHGTSSFIHAAEICRQSVGCRRPAAEHLPAHMRSNMWPLPVASQITAAKTQQRKEF